MRYTTSTNRPWARSGLIWQWGGRSRSASRKRRSSTARRRAARSAPAAMRPVAAARSAGPMAASPSQASDSTSTNSAPAGSKGTGRPATSMTAASAGGGPATTARKPRTSGPAWCSPPAGWAKVIARVASRRERRSGRAGPLNHPLTAVVASSSRQANSTRPTVTAGRPVRWSVVPVASTAAPGRTRCASTAMGGAPFQDGNLQQLVVEIAEAGHVAVERMHRADPGPQPVPQARGADGPLHHLGQAGRVTGPEVQPVHPVGDLLGHAADVAADDGATEGVGLLDDQRRVLPPDRRDHDPVDGPHQGGQLVGAVAADERHVAAGGVEEPAELGLELLGLVLDVGAVESQGGAGPAAGTAVGRRGRAPVGQDLHGL